MLQPRTSIFENIYAYLVDQIIRLRENLLVKSVLIINSVHVNTHLYTEKPNIRGLLLIVLSLRPGIFNNTNVLPFLLNRVFTVFKNPGKLLNLEKKIKNSGKALKIN